MFHFTYIRSLRSDVQYVYALDNFWVVILREADKLTKIEKDLEDVKGTVMWPPQPSNIALSCIATETINYS